jgi:hypothetical protein
MGDLENCTRQSALATLSYRLPDAQAHEHAPPVLLEVNNLGPARGGVQSFDEILDHSYTGSSIGADQANYPCHHAMEVARVMGLGSGQLNISGFELLQKGIKGNNNGSFK